VIKNRSGFTLLEILIAVFLFAIVMSTMFGAYINVFQTIKSTEDDARIYKMARKCMERILMDLESIYVSTPPVWKEPKIGDAEEDDDPYKIVSSSESIQGGSFTSLQFATWAHVPKYGEERKAGIAHIIYYPEVLDEEEDIEFENVVLKRADRTFFETDFERKKSDVTICEWVKSFQLEFFDEEDEGHDQWDSQSDSYDYATPKAIRVRLELRDPKFEEEKTVVFQTRATLFMYRPKKE